MEEKFNEIIKILPIRIKKEMMHREEMFQEAQEIRVRIGKKIHIITGREDRELVMNSTTDEITPGDIREMAEFISGYSMYACEDELRNGFITLKGGHRVGIAGEVVTENGRIKTIKNIASFNIRISRELKGCADELMRYADGNLLIISPPRAGKTTLLRDLLRQISGRPMENVGIVDERSEIAACYRGKPENDVGERTDVLDCCPKAEGMLMLLRSMSPTVIGVDELGKKEDVEAVLRVINCGVRVIATIHGENLEEIIRKEVFQELLKEGIFHHYIVLNQRQIKVYDRSYCEEGSYSR